MKIGIARYPYLKSPLRGGDNTLFDRIQNLYEYHGHNVTNIAYRRPAQVFLAYLPRPLNKLLSWLFDLCVPLFFSIQLKNQSKLYDIILADSAVLTYIGDFNVISVVNIDYDAYEAALNGHLPLRSRIKLMFSKRFQSSAARHYRSVAVSDFVAGTYKQKGFSVFATITNALPFKRSADSPLVWNNRFIFAGSGNFFGKGLDVLLQLARKGFEVDCYTDASFNDLRCFPPLSHEELQLRYLDYSMLIFPSRYESFGFVPLEAMAAGLPVLMRRTGIGVDLEKEIPEFVLSDNEDYIANEVISKVDAIKNDYKKFSLKAKEFTKKIVDRSDFDSSWLDLLKKHDSAWEKQ